MFFSSVTRTWLVQFSSSTERLAKFRWRMASGKHLFPFRTEQLSHSAPMVLGGQPPGRVGRRRFFAVQGRPSRAALFFARSLCPQGPIRPHSHREGRASSGAEQERPLDPVPALISAWLWRGGVGGLARSTPPAGPDWDGLTAPCLAARRGSPNGLQPVLAERGEVDQQVGGVGQPGAYVFA